MQKKRTANFREDETKLLIELWGSPEIQTQLNTSHRKAPIMIQLATLMQQHGFYRTPEEITTRIRNLKCIYHRIKKSQHVGIFGPETADWNHFKAIDAILGDSLGPQKNQDDHDFSGDVKREANLLEVPDSMYNGNSLCSVLEDNDTGAISPVPSPMQRLGVTSVTSTIISPNELLTCSPADIDRSQDFKNDVMADQSGGAINYATHAKRNHENHEEEEMEENVESKRRLQGTHQDNDVSSLLRQLLDVEREHLELEKQRLEMDRQVGSQLLTLVPLVSSILQKHQSCSQSESDNVMEPTKVTNEIVISETGEIESSMIHSDELVPSPSKETSNGEMLNVPNLISDVE